MKVSKRQAKWLYLTSGMSALIFVVLFTASRRIELSTLAQSIHRGFQPEQLVPLVGHQSSSLEVSSETPSLDRSCGAEQDVLGQLVQDKDDIFNLKKQFGFGRLVRYVSTETLAYAGASPFPLIHNRARLARVPVMMYHDIVPERKIYFDITPEELRHEFEEIRSNNLTPISLEQLVVHLKTGLPLPEKPILLTFDDGYAGQYTYAYQLLKEFGYPGAFAIFPAKPDGTIIGRSTITWDQLREMAADPLVTIVSHSVSHPPDLTKLPGDRIRQEVVESKRILEERLGISIHYFAYPEGYYNAEVADMVQAAGYDAALTMDKNSDGHFAGESENLLAIARFGEPAFEKVIEEAWGGPPAHFLGAGLDFTSPVELNRTTIDGVELKLVSGGRPATIHANSRYQVSEILAGTNAVAGVDGAFFSMKYLDSNVMIGPILSQSNQQFVPGLTGVNPFLDGRPLVLISPNTVKFIPFDHTRHNTLEGMQAELPNVTDAFVAAAQVVKDGEAQPVSAMGRVPNADIPRHRAFWGIDATGKPVVGISERVDAADLGEILAKAGFWNAVMLDSGASTSLVYKGEPLIGFVPRPVPHAVVLMPPDTATPCGVVVSQGAEK